MSTQENGWVEHRVQLRLNDFDVLGHLNQSVYHTILEQARTELFGLLAGHNDGFVMAHVEMDYRREVAMPTNYVTVQTRVERIGRSSLTLFQRIVRPEGEVANEATTVLVGWDRTARRSRPFSDEERATFEALPSAAAVSS
ncbi:MAG TPA: thioesterase family protein [Conexibacter sp.]